MSQNCQEFDRTGGSALRGPAGCPVPGAQIWLRVAAPNWGSRARLRRSPTSLRPPARLPREVSNGRPREALSRLEVPRRPSPVQGRRAATPLLPRETDPTHTNSPNLQPRSQLESRRRLPGTRRAHSGSGPTPTPQPPDGGCATGVPRGRARGAARAGEPQESAPGRQAGDPLRLARLGGPRRDRAPTHPIPRGVAGRARTGES